MIILSECGKCKEDSVSKLIGNTVDLGCFDPSSEAFSGFPIRGGIARRDGISTRKYMYEVDKINANTTSSCFQWQYPTIFFGKDWIGKTKQKNTTYTLQQHTMIV